MTRDQSRDVRWRAFLDHVVESPAQLEPEVRAAIRDGSPLPNGLDTLVRAVRSRAHLVSDDDIAGARQDGFSEDEIFDAIVVAACAEGERRLEAVRRCREDAP